MKWVAKADVDNDDGYVIATSIDKVASQMYGQLRELKEREGIFTDELAISNDDAGYHYIVEKCRTLRSPSSTTL